MELQNYDDRYSNLFTSAIGLAADLLFPGRLGIMLGVILITPELAGVLSGALSPPNFEAQSAREGDNEAYLTALARDELRQTIKPFDATLATIIFWQFRDPNNRSHSLTITAELTYEDLSNGNLYILPTPPTTLSMYDVNDPPATPSQPRGRTAAYTGYTYDYQTNTTDPENDPVQYKFDWGDGTYTTTGWYDSGATATASHSWASTGIKYVTVHAQDPYGLWSGWSPILQVSISTYSSNYPPGPAPVCPFVSVWDGSNYVLDNNILPASELSNGADVKDYYRMEQTPVPKNGKYSLLLSEFEHEHSYIDQVKLLAVDHDSDVKIALDPNGQILTYKDPYVPISAVDNHGNNRLNEIRQMDGDVSNPATFFYGNASDYLVLDFGRVNSDNAKLILRDDMKCCEVCIDVQVLNNIGQWQTVTTVTPRSYWAIEGVNLSPYVIKNQDFKVRLLWTSPHRLDYVGLDTTKQADYEVHTSNLVSAVHSAQGDVKALLLENDNIYAELVPGQQIQLEFTLPNNAEEARTYILYSEGHYYTIT